MPRVYNKYHNDAPADAVYIGRGTKWGNPYTHIVTKPTKAEFVVDSRQTAVECYNRDLLNNPELMQAAVKELAGKDLVCFCKPKACHGDLLLAIANNYATILRLPNDAEVR